MMKSVNLLLLCVLLPGCIDLHDDDSGQCKNESHEYTTDQIDSNGVWLKAPADGMYIPYTRVSEIYREVQACVGVSVQGPEIWFVSFSDMGWGSSRGWYHSGAQIVAINSDENDILKRNCIGDEETFKHEFMHHVLYMSGQNHDHGNPYFERCEAMGPKTCNGEPCR